jgi:hypothetical protein
MQTELPVRLSQIKRKEESGVFFASLSDSSKKKKVVIPFKDGRPKSTDDRNPPKPIFSDRLCPPKLDRRRSPTRFIISLIWFSIHSRDICTSLLLNIFRNGRLQ